MSKSLSLKGRIAEDLHLSVNMVEDIYLNQYRKVRVFSIPKRNGGTRRIYHPSVQIKMIQYWLMNNVFSYLIFHKCSMAYKNNVSVLDNALMHKGHKFFLKMDLNSFFPSIRFHDFKPSLIELFKKNFDEMQLNYDDEVDLLIKNICFYKESRLAIGYPSSPMISNAVMFGFDEAVSQLLLEVYGEGVSYTRYADDMIFSTNQKGVCLDLKGRICDLVSGWDSPKISINEKKTKLVSSTGGSAYVTGLKMNEDGRISLPKLQREHIKRHLNLFSKNKLSPEQIMSLSGHLAYCKGVDPVFYNKMSMRFFKEIEVIKRSTSY